jgi:hypothetical protein
MVKLVLWHTLQKPVINLSLIFMMLLGKHFFPLRVMAILVLRLEVNVAFCSIKV